MTIKTVEVQGSVGENFAIEVTCDDHKVIIDQPKNAGGSDLGPTPLQLVLASLAGCFGTIGKFVAHQQKIELRGMKISIQADYDPAGLLGRNADVRPGFQAIRLQADIDADLTQEQKEAFLKDVERRCPLADNLINDTRIYTEVIN